MARPVLAAALLVPVLFGGCSGYLPATYQHAFTEPGLYERLVRLGMAEAAEAVDGTRADATFWNLSGVAYPRISYRPAVLAGDGFVCAPGPAGTYARAVDVDAEGPEKLEAAREYLATLRLASDPETLEQRAADLSRGIGIGCHSARGVESLLTRMRDAGAEERMVGSVLVVEEGAWIVEVAFPPLVFTEAWDDRSRSMPEAEGGTLVRAGARLVVHRSDEAFVDVHDGMPESQREAEDFDEREFRARVAAFLARAGVDEERAHEVAQAGRVRRPT